MNKITIQVPLDKSLKLSAEKVALEQGFSSLQETIRLFLKQFASKNIRIHFSPQDEILSKKQEAVLEKKYLEAKDAIKKGKGFTAHSIQEMMAQLHS